jgi:hypothetical protein
MPASLELDIEHHGYKRRNKMYDVFPAGYYTFTLDCWAKQIEDVAEKGKSNIFEIYQQGDEKSLDHCYVPLSILF